MSYTFKIRRNVFMYNHVLTVSDEQKNYEAIIESAPTREETMVIWLDDFDFSKNEVEIVREEMIKWFATQNIKCIFYEGKGR